MTQEKEITRRNFIKTTGAVIISTGMGYNLYGCASRQKRPIAKIDRSLLSVPPCDGYILVDTKKCQGCRTCMLACSLVHEGEENLSLSRIQVIENPFEKFPDDISLDQCRQCIDPACLKACPTGALHADAKNGNVRRVDVDECVGCKECIDACPYTSGRAIWNFQKEHAQKCDLCAVTPFWDEKGGPSGKQACVTLCPVGAITFTKEIPLQEGNSGYDVNLRGKSWAELGYPVD